MRTEQARLGSQEATPTAIWVICASHGEYSDRSEWTIAVRRTEAEARSLVETFQAAVLQVLPSGLDWWDVEGPQRARLWKRIIKAVGDPGAFDPASYHDPREITLYACGPYALPAATAPLADGPTAQDETPDAASGASATGGTNP